MLDWVKNNISMKWVIIVVLAILVVGLYRSNVANKDYCMVCMGRTKDRCDSACANCVWRKGLLGEGCMTDAFGLLR